MSGQQDQPANRVKPAVETGSLPAIPAIEQLAPITQALHSADPAQVLTAVTQIRRLLSQKDGTDAEIDAVIQSGAVPTLVQLLHHSNPSIQYEALWGLANIASGNQRQTRVVVECGVIPVLIQILKSSGESIFASDVDGNSNSNHDHSHHSKMYDQAAWALGNIAGDCATRDLVLSSGIVQVMKSILANITAAKQQQPRQKVPPNNLVWLAANLCRGKPPPDIKIVGELVPGLCQIVAAHTQSHAQQQQHEEVDGSSSSHIGDAVFALAYICDNCDEGRMLLLQCGLLPGIVTLASSHSSSQGEILHASLRIIGSLFTSSMPQFAAAAIQSNALQLVLVALLREQQESATATATAIQKECLFTLSNALVGPPEIVTVVFQMIASTPTLVRRIVSLASGGSSSNSSSKVDAAESAQVSLEALHVVANLFNNSQEHPQFVAAAVSMIPPPQLTALLASCLETSSNGNAAAHRAAATIRPTLRGRRGAAAGANAAAAIQRKRRLLALDLMLQLIGENEGGNDQQQQQQQQARSAFVNVFKNEFRQSTDLIANLQTIQSSETEDQRAYETAEEILGALGLDDDNEQENNVGDEEKINKKDDEEEGDDFDRDRDDNDDEDADKEGYGF